MSRSLKKVWDTVSSILVALVVVLALLLVGTRIVGLQVFTVLSGSMEPTYHTGSLIYVKKTNTTDIHPGTVITFMLDENTVATHRVVEVVPDEEDTSVIRFRTKGDANEAADGGLVHYKNVIGTPVFTIPYLGYVADYIQHPPGMYVAISAGAVLLLLVFIPDIFADDTEKKKRSGTHKKSGQASRRSSAEYDPDEPVPAERAELLRQAAEPLLSAEELQALDERIAQGPLTRGEYRAIRRRMRQLSEENSAQQ
ncbi:MAG: signal peptidase I [Christensenellales bacterium]